MKYLAADSAMEAAAKALEEWQGDDLARTDALAVYDAAARMKAAYWSTPHVQVDDRIPVPEHVAQFAPVPISEIFAQLAVDPRGEEILDLRKQGWPHTTKASAEMVGRVWAQQMLLSGYELRKTIAIVYVDVAGEPAVAKIESPAGEWERSTS